MKRKKDEEIEGMEGTTVRCLILEIDQWGLFEC